MNVVLILHGWGSCAKNWTQIKELLESQGYEVFLPDLPGFGESPPPIKPWSLDDYAEWLGEFCEKNNLSQIFLLGHSFGGNVAVKFILKYPAKIKKLFLVAPAIVRRKTLKKKIIKKTSKIFSFLPVRIKKIIYRKIIKSDYPLTGGSMRETYLRVINEDLSNELSKISLPTVLIWGEKDDVTPLGDARLIRDRIFGAKLEILPGIYHNPQTENPKLLVKKVLENI